MGDGDCRVVASEKSLKGFIYERFRFSVES